MRFSLFFLVTCGWLCARANGARPPKYTLAPTCEVVHVKDMAEITEHHLHLLTGAKGAEHCILFKLEGSNTFLAKKTPSRWNVDSSVEKFARISSRGRTAVNSGLLRVPFANRFLHVRDETPWVEFYFDEFENRVMDELIPASMCHSEVEGEGSVVSFQSVFFTQGGLAGQLETEFDVFNSIVSTTAEVALEHARTLALKVQCMINHGEVGQLFLAGTRYLFYTPWHRLRVYNAKEKLFSDGGEFDSLARERRVVSGGVGDWVCGTSSKVDLKCHVRDFMNPFLGLAKDTFADFF